MHPEFPLDNDIVHLNHAGIAPWPKRTVDAVTRFANENMTMGSRRYAQWLCTEDALREQLRWLINADSTESISLQKNTSEALSVVAFGIDWQPGNNVVTAKQEFPSNRIVWEALRQRFGVEVRLADLDQYHYPEDALIEHMDANTRLVSVSSIQYATGMRMDLARIGEYCRSYDVIFCVDAIQSLGAVVFDVQAIHADFVMADGHKWMLGPEGVALLYCAPRRLEQLRLNQFGWHMVKHMGDYERMDWVPADNARRFECGSPNSLGIHALHASLSLLQEQGLKAVSEQIFSNIAFIDAGIHALGLECHTPDEPERRGGIITFRVPMKDNRKIYQLMQQAGILCAHRAGGIRFSPHFYTTHASIERALDTLKQIIKSC